MKKPTEIDPKRLFEVADLVLDLIDEGAGSLNLSRLEECMSIKIGTRTMPPKDELTEAVAFLVRAGYIKEAE